MPGPSPQLTNQRIPEPADYTGPGGPETASALFLRTSRAPRYDSSSLSPQPRTQEACRVRWSGPPGTAEAPVFRGLSARLCQRAQDQPWLCAPTLPPRAARCAPLPHSINAPPLGWKSINFLKVEPCGVGGPSRGPGSLARSAPAVGATEATPGFSRDTVRRRAEGSRGSAPREPCLEAHRPLCPRATVRFNLSPELSRDV
ncbi:hypothetical protein NDU88_002432 [Pleurodeles waltl]|uniref:Uncharacterized protein n=1 Tax=Pleurodeles waltl TaxID=8319 RepID=A0AAV7UZS5_PLEWA|nr:hypothetical protein NDU88_002432 [Pleurodeles waltl]